MLCGEMTETQAPYTISLHSQTGERGYPCHPIARSADFDVNVLTTETGGRQVCLAATPLGWDEYAASVVGGDDQHHGRNRSRKEIMDCERRRDREGSGAKMEGARDVIVMCTYE